MSHELTSSLCGRGLFSGREASVILRRVDGPIHLDGVPLDAYGSVPALRTTAIAVHERNVKAEGPAQGRKIAMVEHLLAAFGGLGVHEGIAIEVHGDEIPLLDGGAARWCGALDEVGAAPSPPPRRVAREGEVAVDASIYRFFPRRSAARDARGESAVSLAVTLDFADPRLALHAEWDGDPRDFRERVAPARTFVFAHELEGLAGRGMMAHVDPESVVVIGAEGMHSAGVRASFDEPVRHKLLDWIGDLFLHGGPPEGRIEAFRPGHAANHEAMRRARAMGIVVDR
ncbi:MAG TPA: UDP-3-O-acyl-N-acetylglucosamine deacetylase [Polyangiaceae bacterium]|nr:UDP-3-O-acyl-N-acetylglucosamine deacetylase [Polyangiaceae bacterium]